jgi:nondiscriminating aspartyl-tRNA synthetase
MKTNRQNVPIRTIELTASVGRHVTVAGWLHAIRDMGKFAFLILRDGAGTAQAVASAELVADLGEARCESVIEVEGEVVASEAAPGGAEIQATALRVVTPVSESPPVTLGKAKLHAALPTMLDHAALTLRHPERRAVFRLAAAAMAAFRRTLESDGFVEIQSPKLVESATEGGSNVFEVDYFGRKAYLAQSPQFYKQTMVGVFGRVFEVGPVFRAEPHATSRHVNEYVSLDVELGFIENHRTVMRVLEQVLRRMVETLAERCAPQLELLDVQLPELSSCIPAIEFGEAKQITGAAATEPDLTPAEERTLGEWAREEHGSEFLFVTGYPLAKRPFYTHPSPENPEASNSFDLLFRGTELVTGGQRLHEHGDYLDALESRGLSPEPFAGYLEAFRWGMPPHGGFAIGLERFLMQLLGASNLREVTLFPRDIHRLSP